MPDRMVKIEEKENGYLILVKYPARYCEYVFADTELKEALAKIEKYLKYGSAIEDE